MSYQNMLLWLLSSSQNDLTAGRSLWCFSRFLCFLEPALSSDPLFDVMLSTYVSCVLACSVSVSSPTFVSDGPCETSSWMWLFAFHDLLRPRRTQTAAAAELSGTPPQPVPDHHRDTRNTATTIQRPPPSRDFGIETRRHGKIIKEET
jgi:hypothetical protein